MNDGYLAEGGGNGASRRWWGGVNAVKSGR